MNQFVKMDDGQFRILDTAFDRTVFETKSDEITESLDTNIDNPALEAIGADVLAAAKLSITAALADTDDARFEGTAEAEFAKAYLAQAGQSGRADEITKQASALMKLDRKAMIPVFGSVLREPDGSVPDGGIVADGLDVLKGGIAQAAGRMTFDIDPKHLGLRAPSVTIPLSAARLSGSDLVVPNFRKPGMFESAGASTLDEFETARANADAAALQDGVLDRELFQQMWGVDPMAQSLQGSASEFESVTDRLRLRILSCHCIDETGSSFVERFGDDEMAMAGVTTDEDGDVKTVTERYIGGGFRDGRSRTMNWNWTHFSLNEGSSWPKTYAATLILAEKDNGGLATAMQKIWDAVRSAVQAAIAKAAMAAGVAIGTFLGSPAAGKLIGAAIAKLVNWVIDKLIGWVINAFRDDIFAPRTLRLTVPSVHARWRYSNGTWGSTHSPVRTLRFHGHKGIYDLRYQWALTT